MEYKIVGIKDNIDLIDDVIVLGDSQKDTLGFLPAQAFVDYAQRGSILVAISSVNTMVGYALYANARNKVCRLAHVCVEPCWRKQGVGNALVSHLKQITTQMDCIAVKCRRDYGIDKFWEKNGFIAKNEVPGRGYTDTTLTLWEYRQRISLLSLPPETERPLAVLDLNVIIDAKSDSNNECKSLLNFIYADEIDFRISEHSFTEINRSGDKSTRKTTRSILNSLRRVEICHDNETINSILNIIGKSNADDAQQVSSAVNSNAEYFITRDSNIICHHETLQKKFGLNVYTPTEFIVNYCNGSGRDLYFPGFANNSEIAFKPIGKFNISELFQKYKFPDEKKSSFRDCISINTPDSRNHAIFRIVAHSTEIGVCVQAKHGNTIEIRLLRLKKSINHIRTISVHVAEGILCKALSQGASDIRIIDQSSGRFIEQAFVDIGFQRDGHGYYRRIQKGFISTSQALKILKANTTTGAPLTTMDFVDIESSLWPAKIIELDLPVYVIPIQPKWAKRLISAHGHQLSLLGPSDVMLQTRRIYYRSTKGIPMHSPARIVWYITKDDTSGLRRCAVGISQAKGMEVEPAKILFKKYEKYGVYGWNDILKKAKNNPHAELMAITFDKTELFSAQIELAALTTIIMRNEGRRYNPVAPFKISKESFMEIYNHGTSST